MTQPLLFNFKSPRVSLMLFYGLLLGLSAPGYGLGWLAWVGLIPPLKWASQVKSVRWAAWGGFGFGFCFQAVYCLWFFDLHPLTWLGFDEIGSRLVTLAGWSLIGIEGGLLTAVFFAVYALWQGKRWLKAAGMVVLWAALFSLLNLTPMALPWGLLEYTQASVPWGRALAGLVGGTGLTMTILLYNTLWAMSGFEGRVFNFRLPVWLTALIPVGLVFLGWHWLIPAQNLPRYPVPVAVIQANLPIERIRSGSLSKREIEPAYIEPIRNQNLPLGTLVVLPEEGVVPGLTPMARPEQNPLFHALMDLSAEKKVWIAVGVSAFKPPEQFYNSIALISPELKSPVRFYHKRRLVPFGEFTPYGLGPDLARLLAALQVDYSAPYLAGNDAMPLRMGRVRLGGLVCFELIDAGLADAYRRKEVDLLINLSNLGWFHQNSLLEAQFLAIGQIRAAESHLPLVIASNTGISAILSSSGTILKSTLPAKQSKNRLNSPRTQIIFYNSK